MHFNARRAFFRYSFLAGGNVKAVNPKIDRLAPGEKKERNKMKEKNDCFYDRQQHPCCQSVFFRIPKKTKVRMIAVTQSAASTQYGIV